PAPPAPPHRPGPGPAAGDPPLRGLQQCSGDYVQVSGDGLSVRHRDDRGDVMHGVVLSRAPLARGRAGLYFEVEVTEVRPDPDEAPAPDGLTLGVTATAPAGVRLDPPTAEHIPETWAMGYDGQMWDPVAQQLSPIDWDPRCLREGDTVGVLVTGGS
ncbi:unnamed protein product, partial [Prorocentrum cordatum]